MTWTSPPKDYSTLYAGHTPPDPARYELDSESDFWTDCIAPGAIHDSTERFDAPRCYPQTREAIQSRILDLITEYQSRTHPSTQIVWLSGPFGTGKSAIQQTIAEKCDAAGTLAASFFFSHQSSERNSSRKFVHTIAYQVAKNLPGTRQHIEAAALGITTNQTNQAQSYDPFPSMPECTGTSLATVEYRPFTTEQALPTDGLSSLGLLLRQDIPIWSPRGGKRALASLVEDDLASQLSTLIIEPLQIAASQSQSQDSLPGGVKANVLIIDGLDECKDEKQQAEIVTVLHAAVVKQKLPFFIIISSRPEAAIEKCFSQLWGPIFDKIDLKTNQDADKDIAIVLRAAFHDICKKHAIAQKTWPEEGDIEQLVRNASGQFIYATIALKLNDGSAPRESLKSILAENKATEHPSAHIDTLFTLVLQRCGNPKKAVVTLLAINRYSWFRKLDVEYFFQEKIDNNLFLLFKSMPAIPDIHSQVVIYHKSLMDFLDDPLRSGNLYLDQHALYQEILPYYLGFYDGTSKRLHDNRIYTRDQLQELHDDFLRFLPSADLCKRDLRQKLKAYNLAWWSALSSPEKLSNSFWAFHQAALGCKRFRCGRVCQKWRKIVTQRCTSSGCDLPPRPIDRLSSYSVIGRWFSSVIPLS
ncbi:hypothetical protein FA15DRAFT_674266 [Coprinopsis marcescibilis]|uniref:Nephrocystin 3-like N-terminal domain-containing protein n=1 Tax=Coprinopsis marcescibilis TaxID=230819 RepID=A0A5C3KHD1_COPMA|nr:hypothetical protein FA15DRAFT_674266 [Coprinopsis marcescibilis]